MVPTSLQQQILTHVLGLEPPLTIIGSHTYIDNALHQVALTYAKCIGRFFTKHTSLIYIARWHPPWPQFYWPTTTTDWYTEYKAMADLLTYAMAYLGVCQH
jgi:hypothetical protein